MTKVKPVTNIDVTQGQLHHLKPPTYFFSEEDLKKKLEQLQTDKAKNEKEYAEWQASCEAWKKSHANHPNKELFNKYNEEVLIFIGKVIRVSKRYKTL